VETWDTAPTEFNEMQRRWVPRWDGRARRDCVDNHRRPGRGEPPHVVSAPRDVPAEFREAYRRGSGAGYDRAMAPFDGAAVEVLKDWRQAAATGAWTAF